MVCWPVWNLFTDAGLATTLVDGANNICQGGNGLSVKKAKITKANAVKLKKAAVEVIKALPTSEVMAGKVVKGLDPNSKGTLDNLLNFLKDENSPVSGIMELRSLLLGQKEEKIVLRSLVEQMRVDLQGIRYTGKKTGPFFAIFQEMYFFFFSGIR